MKRDGKRTTAKRIDRNERAKRKRNATRPTPASTAKTNDQLILSKDIEKRRLKQFGLHHRENDPIAS